MVKFLSSFHISFCDSLPQLATASAADSTTTSTPYQHQFVLFPATTKTPQQRGDLLQPSFYQALCSYLLSKGFHKTEETQDQEAQKKLNEFAVVDGVWRLAGNAKHGAVTVRITRRKDTAQGEETEDSKTSEKQLEQEDEEKNDDVLRCEVYGGASGMSYEGLMQSLPRPLLVKQSIEVAMAADQQAAGGESQESIDQKGLWWGLPVKMWHPTMVRQERLSEEEVQRGVVGPNGWVTVSGWLKEVGYKLGLEAKYGA